ncbi:MAG: 50S ribosomal protein L29 [Acidobacteriaceae bacterium]
MELQKIREMTPDELAHRDREAGEQMFRLRFQAKLGQADSTQQIRILRKDIARAKTIARERELGLAVAPVNSGGRAKAKPVAEAKATAKQKTTSKKSKKAAVK